jgi:hypothetical protein
MPNQLPYKRGEYRKNFRSRAIGDDSSCIALRAIAIAAARRFIEPGLFAGSAAPSSAPKRMSSLFGARSCCSDLPIPSAHQMPVVHPFSHINVRQHRPQVKPRHDDTRDERTVSRRRVCCKFKNPRR